MRRLQPLILLLVMIGVVMLWHQRAAAPVTTGSTPISITADASGTALPSLLPPEARITLDAIARGGPFPHRQDGVVFGNYEGLLPQQPRGYYHEYTVETPGADTRGTRRIITGGTPPAVYYYTDDHYRSFHRFEVAR